MNHDDLNRDDLLKLLEDAEDKLQLSENKLNYLNSIMEGTEDAIIGQSLDGTILSWNQGAEKIYGYTAQEVIGSSVSILIPPYNADELSLILAWIKTGERVSHYETLRRRKDKSLVNISLSISPIKDNNGNIVGASAISRDISEKKKMELAMQESEEKFREVFNNANDAIFLHPITPDGSPGMFTEVNDVACERLGYTREELLQMGPWDIDNLETRRRMPDNMAKIKSGGKATFESVQVTKNGEEIPVEINAHVFTLRGDKVVLSIGRDITLRKKREAELQKSLEEKEMLLKEIHHRVKNNLNVISSLLNLQSRYIKDKAALEVFRESQRRARSMALIHKMLYQSKDLKCIDFGEYLETLAGELFHSYVTDPESVKLNLVVGKVQMDINTSIPLGLIVNELISNSLKHAFPEGYKGELTVKLAQEGSYYHLIVADDGVGLPEDLDLEKTNSLGMRLVNTLIKQIKGEIEFKRDNGTKIIIKFREEVFRDNNNQKPEVIIQS